MKNEFVRYTIRQKFFYDKSNILFEDDINNRYVMKEERELDCMSQKYDPGSISPYFSL